MPYITYEQFGAVGDGRADDMDAIINAHEEANRLGLPVRAKEGAAYYIAPKAKTAVIETDTDWSGASVIIDDVGLDDIHKPVFDVPPKWEEAALPLKTLKAGQTRIENPSGRELLIFVENENHKDYIRFGANQNNGHSRTDVLLAAPDGSLSTPVSFDFDEITSVRAYVLGGKPLTLKGGCFKTIANQCESKYNYHARNIRIGRPYVTVTGVSHFVEGEPDHGAPYAGFISINDTAHIRVEDCLFTGHRIYWTIGAANVPVPMGSYDINCARSADVAFARCSQTTDIMDTGYWGLIGTNFCRELLLEDCVFSRFDAHMGVSFCTIRRCRLGWQCLNAIGFGKFTVEDTEACGFAFVSLRGDYGCTWKGDFEIRNCVWRPLGGGRAIFRAENNGRHDFGYTCYLPQNITVDGLKIETDGSEPVDKVYVINDWTKEDPSSVPYPMVPPKTVRMRNVTGAKGVEYCENGERRYGTDVEIG